MEQFKVIKDTFYLIPNKEHKNFTQSTEKVNKDQILTGKLLNVSGLRRGKPFDYRLFLTNDKKYIYQNCVEPMKTTEITLGADSAQTPTVIDLRQNETFSRNKVIGIVAGATAGFAYSKYKKHQWKKVFMYSALGAALGYGAAYLFDRNKSIEVTPSK